MTDIDDPQLTLAALFRARPETAPAFWRRGLACVGCPIAPFHTVRDTCREYGLDEPAFRRSLRETAAARPRQSLSG